MAFAMATFLLVGLGSIYLYLSLAQFIRKEGNDELRHAVSAVVQRLNSDDELPDRELLDVEDRVLVRVTDASGHVLIETDGMSHIAPLQAFPLPHASWLFMELQGPTGAKVKTLAAQYRKGWVQVARDLGYEERLLAKFRKTLFTTLSLTSLFAALTGYWMAKRGLSSLSDLALQADSIHPETLGTRLSPTGFPVELEPLTHALNRTLSRLETAFAGLSTLNADMAHELRTPLHALRLETEILLSLENLPESMEERLAGMIETLDHMGAMIEQMLFLARSEDPATIIERNPLNVKTLLDSGKAPFESLAEERDISLEVTAPADLRVFADATLLRRALHNLLANALRHAPPRTVVRLNGRAEDDKVVLRISDEGTGIPAAFLAQLGQRFIRPDASRSRETGGAGLGLAIVQSILRLHGGTMIVRSEQGQGTSVDLIFPQI